jgi:hypothetical protein
MYMWSYEYDKKIQCKIDLIYNLLLRSVIIFMDCVCILLNWKVIKKDFDSEITVIYVEIDESLF